MSYIRLYVESTESLMGQGKKMRLISPPKDWFDNMCSQDSLFVITNTKETKLSLIW